jgi:cell division protein FtsA
VGEVAEQVFDAPVRLGAPSALGGWSLGGLVDVVRSPIYSTGVGLALYGARGRSPAPVTPDRDEGSMLSRLSRRVSDWMSDAF